MSYREHRHEGNFWRAGPQCKCNIYPVVGEGAHASDRSLTADCKNCRDSDSNNGRGGVFWPFPGISHREKSLFSFFLFLSFLSLSFPPSQFCVTHTTRARRIKHTNACVYLFLSPVYLFASFKMANNVKSIIVTENRNGFELRRLLQEIRNLSISKTLELWPSLNSTGNS